MAKIITREMIEEMKERFCKETPMEEVSIRLYHGTDRFVWDMEKPEWNETRKMLESYIRGLQSDREFLEKIPKVSNEQNALEWMFNDQQYQYDSLCTTADIGKAVRFSKMAVWFGELGTMAHTLKEECDKLGYSPNVDSSIIKFVSDFFTEREKAKSNPVLLYTEDLGAIESTIAGKPVLLEDIKIEYIKRALQIGGWQENYIMKAGCTLEKYTEIGVEDAIKYEKYMEDQLKTRFEKYVNGLNQLSSNSNPKNEI